MPLTPAEKQRLYRERMKAKGLHLLIKEKDKKRKSEKRKSLAPKELKSLQLQEKIRKRNSRLITNKAPVTSSHPYSSPKTLSKAVHRALKSLPASPRKKIKVVETLASRCDISLPIPKAAIPDAEKKTTEIEKQVVEFYLRDNISWQAPGKKDYVIIRKNGNKEKVQKRFLVMTLSETHALFQQENDTKVSLSKFCELRPQFVLLRKNFPHNICVCKYHENVRLLIRCLTAEINGFPTNFHDFISTIVCDPNNESCMFRNCKVCENHFDKTYLNVHKQNLACLKWEQWDTENQKAVKKGYEGSVNECLHLLKGKICKFLRHTYIKRQQHKFFEQRKEKANERSVVVQVDFAENFSIKIQDEIQAAHWHHQQVTIFTGYVWYGLKKGTGYAFVSDEMDHGKVTVFACIDALIHDLLVSFPQLECISFFSDGAASQFKQKYLFTNLTFMLDQYNIKATWSFFATSHGKGAVDGIGGTVKRVVWSNILAGRCVSTAKDFADVASENSQNIRIEYLSKEEIYKFREDLLERWSNIHSLPDTHNAHYLIPITNYVIEYSEYSFSTNRKRFNFKENIIMNEVKDDDTSTMPNDTLTVGQFLLVEWKGKRSKKNYVGQVIHIEDEGIEISCLRKHDNEGFIFMFPEKDDKCLIDRDQIIQKLKNPEILTDGSGTRLRCRFKFQNALLAE